MNPNQQKSNWPIRMLALLTFSLTVSYSLEAAPAQDSTRDIDRAKQEFEAAIDEWKQAAKNALHAMREFSFCESQDAEKWRKEWQEAIAAGNAARDKAADKAVIYFRVADGMRQAEPAARMVFKMIEFDINSGRFNRAYKICSELVKLRPGDINLLAQLGVLSIKTNRFHEAAEIRKRIEPSGRRDLIRRFDGLDELLATWKVEEKLQKEEADTNPRVKLVTTQGTIELELFEKQAPETVANFIYLVKEGFYDGLKFHRVMSGFMAQTGCPNGDGSGDAGYSIYDEHHRPDARKHFRGVISMANISQPNTGGSQFFLTFAPVSRLDGKHTVFGRVVKGDEVLEKLKVNKKQNDEGKEVNVEGVTPDEILKAEVLRDSGKDYQPKKVDR